MILLIAKYVVLLILFIVGIVLLFLACSEFIRDKRTLIVFADVKFTLKFLVKVALVVGIGIYFIVQIPTKEEAVKARADYKEAFKEFILTMEDEEAEIYLKKRDLNGEMGGELWKWQIQKELNATVIQEVKNEARAREQKKENLKELHKWQEEERLKQHEKFLKEYAEYAQREGKK